MMMEMKHLNLTENGIGAFIPSYLLGSFMDENKSYMILQRLIDSYITNELTKVELCKGGHSQSRILKRGNYVKPKNLHYRLGEKRTPAQRLGITDKQFDLKDILYLR